jgi:hypothetical protein
MWKNVVEPDRPQMKIWRLRIACLTPKATNTHLEYVTNIAFPLQKLLHGIASMLRATCIVLLVIFIKYIIFSEVLHLEVYKHPFLLY